MNYNKIKELQEQNKVSNREISKKIGMSDVGYGKMLDKKTCDVATLESIADFFKVSVCEFFENEDPEQLKNKDKQNELCLDCEKKQEEIDRLNVKIQEVYEKYTKCLEELNNRMGGNHIANSA